MKFVLKLNQCSMDWGGQIMSGYSPVLLNFAVTFVRWFHVWRVTDSLLFTEYIVYW